MSDDTKNSPQEGGSTGPSKGGFFKHIKDMKRRSVESVLETIGVSERTVDNEYIETKKNFDKCVKELNDLSHGMAQFVEAMGEMYTAADKLAETACDYYWGRLMLDWPGAPNNLKSHNTAQEFRDAWKSSNQVVRQSVSKELQEQGVMPIRTFINTILPEMHSQVERREGYVKDVDSYRRRFSALQEKKNKITDNTSQKFADVDKEMKTIQTKLTVAGDNYTKQNTQVKENMLAAKASRDDIIETALVTMIACQIELFNNTAERLSKLLEFVPADKLAAVQGDIQAMIAAGGAEHVPRPRSVLMKSQSSGRVSSPWMNTTRGLSSNALSPTIEENDRSSPTGSQSSDTQTPGRNPFDTTFRENPALASGPNPFEATQRGPAPPAQPSPPPAPSQELEEVDLDHGSAPSAPARKDWRPEIQVLATALFDNEAEDETELSFKAGDVLEILKREDSGWWEARVEGRAGLIPSNYVELM